MAIASSGMWMASNAAELNMLSYSSDVLSRSTSCSQNSTEYLRAV